MQDICSQRGGLNGPPFFCFHNGARISRYFALSYLFMEIMNETALKKTVIRLAEPVVRALGLVIWGVEVAQAGRMVVRLFVDVPARDPEDPARAVAADDGEGHSPHSASLGQCEEISRHLGLALEVEDAVPAAYVLEVSTPGLTRLFFSLEQMRPYLGDVVEARLHAPLAPEGCAQSGAVPRRLWRGRLAAVQADAFVLEPVVVSAEGEVSPEALPPVRLPWTDVRRVSRVYIFRQPVKPGKGPGKGSGKGPEQGAGKRPGEIPGKGTGKGSRDTHNGTSPEAK